mmetsp:Transcript_17389/g.29991  ORF Transcript_17389/g.29991 Transcript_17389/m.29991 type:complete len:276 (-) Transcript_17389:35-862(-)
MCKEQWAATKKGRACSCATIRAGSTSSPCTTSLLRSKSSPAMTSLSRFPSSPRPAPSSDTFLWCGEASSRSETCCIAVARTWRAACPCCSSPRASCRPPAASAPSSAARSRSRATPMCRSCRSPSSARAACCPPAASSPSAPSATQACVISASSSTPPCFHTTMTAPMPCVMPPTPPSRLSSPLSRTRLRSTPFGHDALVPCAALTPTCLTNQAPPLHAVPLISLPRPAVFRACDVQLAVSSGTCSSRHKHTPTPSPCATTICARASPLAPPHHP